MTADESASTSTTSDGVMTVARRASCVRFSSAHCCMVSLPGTAGTREGLFTRGGCEAGNPFGVEAPLSARRGGFSKEGEGGGDGRLCWLGCAIRVGEGRDEGVEVGVGARGHGGAESA